MKEPMVVHCAKCEHEWAPCFLPASVDVLSKTMKSKCPACGSAKSFLGPVPKESADGDYIGWLSNGDTGLSSKVIWHRMTGRPNRDNSYPLDPSDFGRCYRLLKIMPSWRARIAEMGDVSAVWKRLAESWEELTALYERELPSGRCPALYDRMKQLEDGKRVSAPSSKEPR